MISRETTMKRIILVRIAPGEDILLGLREAVEKHGIKNGLFLTGFGSSSHSRQSAPSEDGKADRGTGWSACLLGVSVCPADAGRRANNRHAVTLLPRGEDLRTADRPAIRPVGMV